jgi:hypothetical protein
LNSKIAGLTVVYVQGLSKKKKMKRGQAYLGIGYEMINFEDNQTIRNQTKATKAGTHGDVEYAFKRALFM